MILWTIALLIVTCSVIVGYYQGALRSAFSLVGLLLAALLGSPIGSLLSPLIAILGVKNPVVLAFIGPIVGFLIVLVGLQLAGLAVHKKIDTYYKYKSSDTQRLLFERMNSRVGASVGAANGFIYALVLGTLLYSLGYLTTQVASSDQDSWALRLVNRLGADVASTGMTKSVSPFMPKSELYYDASDVVADIFHTPLLQQRLANYPPFLLVGDNEQFAGLSDTSFQNDWLKGSLTFGSFVNHDKIKPLLENQEVVTNVLGMLGGNFKDLKVYLETGKSPKYDDERILGNWEFDYKASVNATRRRKANMGSRELTNLRRYLAATFLNSTLTTTIDQRAVLKHAKSGDSPAKVTKGNWKTVDGRYVLTIREDDKTMELDAMVDGKTIQFSRDGIVLVFENTRV